MENQGKNNWQEFLSENGGNDAVCQKKILTDDKRAHAAKQATQKDMTDDNRKLQARWTQAFGKENFVVKSSLLGNVLFDALWNHLKLGFCFPVNMMGSK